MLALLVEILGVKGIDRQRIASDNRVYISFTSHNDCFIIAVMARNGNRNKSFVPLQNGYQPIDGSGKTLSCEGPEYNDDVWRCPLTDATAVNKHDLPCHEVTG